MHGSFGMFRFVCLYTCEDPFDWVLGGGMVRYLSSRGLRIRIPLLRHILRPAILIYLCLSDSFLSFSCFFDLEPTHDPWGKKTQRLFRIRTSPGYISFYLSFLCLFFWPFEFFSSPLWISTRFSLVTCNHYVPTLSETPASRDESRRCCRLQTPRKIESQWRNGFAPSPWFLHPKGDFFVRITIFRDQENRIISHHIKNSNSFDPLLRKKTKKKAKQID